MKEKDITEKVLLGYNDVFADIVNGVIFNGQNIVKCEDLSDASLITQFKDDKNIYHEQIRDIAKFWKKSGIIFSFIGVENQTVPDKDMILRVISYDGATYKDQIGNERIYPVFTIIIYWGKAEWKAPTSLKERIDCPVELDNIISDYKFELIDIMRLLDKDAIKYQSDFRFVIEILTKQNNYKPSKEEIKHPEELLNLLYAVAGDDRFYKAKEELKNIKKEGSKVNMCELLDTIENRGIEKGIEKGMEKGREEGERLATFRIAKKFKYNNVDIDIIIKSTGLTREQVEEL